MTRVEVLISSVAGLNTGRANVDRYSLDRKQLVGSIHLVDRYRLLNRPRLDQRSLMTVFVVLKSA